LLTDLQRIGSGLVRASSRTGSGGSWVLTKNEGAGLSNERHLVHILVTVPSKEIQSIL
jgi:hypothetical protein